MKIIKQIFLLTIFVAYTYLSGECNQQKKCKILITDDEWPQLHTLAQQINTENKS